MKNFNLKTTILTTRNNLSSHYLLPAFIAKPFAYTISLLGTRTIRSGFWFFPFKFTKLLNNVSNTQSISYYTSVSYVPSKSLINCFISLVDLNNKDTFYNKIKYIDLSKDQRYTVYIKVRYNIDMFFMVGNQFGFHYDSEYSFVELFDNINIKLDEYLSSYNLTDEDIIYIQISFRLLDKKILNNLKLTENIYTNTNEDKRLKSTISIPVFKNLEDLKQLGVCLPVHYDTNNTITNIEMTVNGIKINFWEKIIEKSNLIRKNKVDTKLDSSYVFVYIKSKIDYILAVKQISEHSIEILKFSISGIFISKFIDSFSENLITREKANEKVFINDKNEITKTVSNIKLDKLSKYKLKYDYWHENPNIGVIDTETYLSDDNVQKIYALGFKTVLSPECYTYYINTELDSSKIVLEMINELLRPKYNKIKFYCHNLGGYDVVFILKILNFYNDNNDDKYDVNCILRDDVIIKMTIRKDGNRLEIGDSYCILTSSLEKLGKDFSTNVKKSYFPYKFAIEKNLFYKGVTPSILFYKDISIENYNKLYSEDWDFKQNTISYLKDDLNCLYEVLTKANKQIHNDYKINIMEANTISSLAMKLYLNQFYNDNIPSINKHSIYTDMKQGYYGGITEVYIPYGENLFYYDVNSLYPFAALNPMPGLSCSKVNFYNTDVYVSNPIKDLFGFFYCKIESPLDLYLGLLPIRNKGGIMMPLGTWEGWYFSEELKFAEENGYKITVYKGYNFNRVDNTFKKYIHEIYKTKSNPINNSQKVMAKSLINNLLGRFGINLDKPKTSIMSRDEFEYKSLINKIYSYKQLGSNNLLVTYSDKLDWDIIKSHGLDILKVLNKNKDKETTFTDNSSIVMSSAVTAYARIHISKIKLYILNKGGNIYYSDTDSIVTDIKLPDNMVNSKELGLLKLEHIIDKAIFITGKTYCLIDNKGNYINKIKGVKSSCLSYVDYEKLLDNITLVTGIKSMSKKDWSLGEVKIFDKENITINSDSYTKRSKIIKEGRWINTKPNIINTHKKMYHTYANKIFINYFDKNLVLYINNTSLIVYKANNISLIVYKANNTSLLIYKPDSSLIYSSDSSSIASLNKIGKRVSNLSNYLYPLLWLFILLYVLSFFLIEESPESTIDIEELPESKSNSDIKDSHRNLNAHSEENSSKSSYFNTWISLFKPSLDNKINCSNDLFKNVYYIEKSFTEKNLNPQIKSGDSISDKAFNHRERENITLSSEVQAITLDTENISKDNTTIFTPFTPNTLEVLNHEIETTNKLIKKIISNTDNRELSVSTARKLSSLLEDQQYLLNQHKNHIEACVDKSNVSLDRVESKLSDISQQEIRLNEMKENLMDYKHKLIQDINYNKNRSNLDSDSDHLTNTRKISTFLWKESLSLEEIKFIDALEDKVLKDTIKNRIELEKK